MTPRQIQLRSIFTQAIQEAQRLGYKDAFIAGGAVRDMLLGNEPRDIDVFTWMTIPEEDLMFESSSDPAGDTTGRVAGVSQTRLKRIGDFDLELIQLKKKNIAEVYAPAHYVSDFALGIDQAWFDGRSVYRSKAFNIDARESRFTVTRAQTDHEARRTIAKINRLWSRGLYLHHDLVIPAQFLNQFFTAAWYEQSAGAAPEGMF